MPAPDATGCPVAINQVMQRFGDATALENIDLTIERGELLALLGPSGCGKSTLLRIIAGFTRQTAGTVLFDGRAVDHLPPDRRGVGIVFQNYALFPHMTVRDNVAYGLVARRWKRDRIAAQVDRMLDLVHMGRFDARYPRQLSGGQQQRVALARCLAIDPKVLLLDEPFGALDKSLRLDVQIEVKRLQRECGITTILVTHDQEEALSMADRTAVMSRGRIEQVAPPTTIYDAPETLFVSQFVGTCNLLPGTVAATNGGSTIVQLDSGGTIEASGNTFATGSEVQVAIRPEQFELHAAGTSGLPGVVKAAMPLGPHIVYEVALAPALAVKVMQPRAPTLEPSAPGTHVALVPASSRACRLFPR